MVDACTNRNEHNGKGDSDCGEEDKIVRQAITYEFQLVVQALHKAIVDAPPPVRAGTGGSLGTVQKALDASPQVRASPIRQV